MSTPFFHLAFPVNELAGTRSFYVDILQCEVGRESERWIDFNFYGHQITAHLDESVFDQFGSNKVDEHAVPARHFGLILGWEEWDQLVERLRKLAVTFYIEPTMRFAGKIGEQRTFFIQDPSKNFLEFKCFRNQSTIFEPYET